MQIGWPERKSGSSRGGCGGQGVEQKRVPMGKWNADVIDQCVKPNVSHKIGIERDGDAPIEPHRWAADAKIFQLVIL